MDLREIKNEMHKFIELTVIKNNGLFCPEYRTSRGKHLKIKVCEPEHSDLQLLVQHFVKIGHAVEAWR